MPVPKPRRRTYPVDKVVHIKAHDRTLYRKTDEQRVCDFIDQAAYRIASYCSRRDGRVSPRVKAKVEQLMNLLDDHYFPSTMRFNGKPVKARRA